LSLKGQAAGAWRGVFRGNLACLGDGGSLGDPTGRNTVTVVPSPALLSMEKWPP
jgi:hypothetical protein